MGNVAYNPIDQRMNAEFLSHLLVINLNFYMDHDYRIVYLITK